MSTPSHDGAISNRPPVAESARCQQSSAPSSTICRLPPPCPYPGTETTHLLRTGERTMRAIKKKRPGIMPSLPSEMVGLLVAAVRGDHAVGILLQLEACPRRNLPGMPCVPASPDALASSQLARRSRHSLALALHSAADRRFISIIA